MKIYALLVFTIFLLGMNMYPQHRDTINFTGILAVEVCRQNEFSPCFNFCPSIQTKDPGFYKIGKNGQPDFTTVYRIPFPTLGILESNNIDRLFNAAYNQKPITDSLDICLPPKQVKRINRFIKKQIKSVRKNYDKKTKNKVNYTFDGCVTYYLYKVNFLCAYYGKSIINVVNTDGNDLILEKEAGMYYIKKVISIEPIRNY